MDEGIDIYCRTCFAMPGEVCRSKYLIHGQDEITPVICATHSDRLTDSQREFGRHFPVPGPASSWEDSFDFKNDSGDKQWNFRLFLHVRLEQYHCIKKASCRFSLIRTIFLKK
jgi:hypothetical protein